MLRNLEQVDYADKAAASRKLRGDLGEADLEHLRDDDLAGRKCITSTDLHVRLLPQANGARDFAIPDAITKFAKKLHLGQLKISAPKLSLFSDDRQSE